MEKVLRGAPQDIQGKGQPILQDFLVEVEALLRRFGVDAWWIQESVRGLQGEYVGEEAYVSGYWNSGKKNQGSRLLQSELQAKLIKFYKFVKFFNYYMKNIYTF